MKEIITDLEKLEVAEPLEFISDIGIEREEGDKIIADIKEIMEANPEMITLSAPQIGYNKRIFCIRFNDIIKTFIDPVITKKTGSTLVIETCSMMPGKEILIARPEEITVVYYTDDFKYEENKLVGPAAAIFDQQVQLLDCVFPSELGLVSDIEEDGSLNDLTEEEFEELKEIYIQFIKIKAKQAEEEASKNEELAKQYRQLKFTEDVVNGRTLILESDEEAETRAILNKRTKAHKIQTKKAESKYEFKAGVNRVLNQKKGKK
jgi:peptide deformylase